MKIKLILTLALALLYLNLNAQEINFEAYQKIMNEDFESFTNLFEQKELPLSTDYLVNYYDFVKMNQEKIPNKYKSFLKFEGDYIHGPLFTRNDDSHEGGFYKEYGYYHPLYKLPTNGDYVILVFAQTSEVNKYSRVFAYSYELDGDFINVISELYSPLAVNVNHIIDEELKTHDLYPLWDRSNPRNHPGIEEFMATLAHSIWQIDSTGKANEVSFEKTEGVKFKYNNETYMYDVLD